MPVPASLALLLTLALTGPARATQVAYKDQPCPVDPDDTARVYEQITANTLGGYDSDGATYSSQGQFREYAVATCTRSFFSLYGGDMGMALDAGQLSRLNGALAEERTHLADPSNPAVWERYAIAARMYRELGRGSMFLAELYVQASWTARDQAVGVYIGLRGPQGARETLSQGEVELRKDLSPAQRKTLTYNMARVAERGGFMAERDKWLSAFEQLGGLSDKEQAALVQFRQLTGTVEPALQDQAIAAIQVALQDKTVPLESRARATYTLADLMRRRGQVQEALGLYGTVMSDDHAPSDLREMALFLSKELSG